ncbi:hypothetical protein EDB87DRAFT_1581266 [Lactarius vividus]|nr:hypothetical protein EDB87DRAFT_1581266 [Lactarius vividus]
MPPRIEAGTPEGHSLALFSDDHPARHEVDRALALVADPGAAGDVHRFRLSMKRKQALFARMRDLDIAWNDWLADAEGIDSRIRASNITSRIYPYLPRPLPRGLDVYHITELHSDDRRFRAHMDHLDGLIPIPVPPPRAREQTTTRDPRVERPTLHGEEPCGSICLYCNLGHVARDCPRPHVLCGRHSTRCHVLVHHVGFGTSCPACTLHSPRPEPYDRVNPDRLRRIDEVARRALEPREGAVSRARDTVTRDQCGDNPED